MRISRSKPSTARSNSGLEILGPAAANAHTDALRSADFEIHTVPREDHAPDFNGRVGPEQRLSVAGDRQAVRRQRHVVQRTRDRIPFDAPRLAYFGTAEPQDRKSTRLNS